MLTMIVIGIMVMIMMIQITIVITCLLVCASSISDSLVADYLTAWVG